MWGLDIAYDRLREAMPARADKEYLQILELAALTGEELVAAALNELFEKGQEISAESVAARLDGQRGLLIEPNPPGVAGESSTCRLRPLARQSV